MNSKAAYKRDPYPPAIIEDDDNYATFNQHIFEYNLDELFKNRMNKLVYSPNNFDLTLLMQYSDKKLIHFSLLEPTKAKV